MAKFQATSAKDTENLALDETLAADQGVILDTKKTSLGADSSYSGDGVIDISNDVSALDTATLASLYKTVSVSADYTGSVDIYGNSNVANTFYAGGGGGIIDGGAGYVNDKSKVVTSADKIYGGAGADTYVYYANGGKDNIYNYGDTDVIEITGYTETQSLSFVDKAGALTITLSDSADSTVSKNSVLTIDGKTRAGDTLAGFTIAYVDDEGSSTVKSYGKMDGYGYGTNAKSGKEDTTLLTVSSGVSNSTIDVNWISSTIKNIDATGVSKSLYIKGNANATTASIGSGGGTLEGGYDSSKGKAVADNLYGTTTAGKAVTFVVNGGKDTFYNFKNGDNIVFDTSVYDPAGMTVKESGSDITYTLNKDTSFTIKNVLGQMIKINGVNDEEHSHTLPTGLVYDSKIAQITANDAIISANLPYDLVPVTIDGEEYFKKVYSTDLDPIYIGGSYENSDGDEIDVPFDSTVTTINLSASSAPVIVDTSEEYGAKVTAITTGKSGGTVTGNAAVQTFTGGNGDDLFVINSAKILDADASVKAKAKADSIVNLGASGTDYVSIVGATAENLSFVEKGKDLNINLTDEDGTYTIVTVKNFDSSTGVTVLGDDDFEKAYGTLPAGLSYADKSGKVDKSGLIAGTNDKGVFTETSIVAEDFGGSAIKTIDARAVTGSRTLSILGSSAANTLYAPTSTTIATTLDGGTGADNLYGASAIGGQTTYVFQPQVKGKKDTIYNFNDGDIIVIDQRLLVAEDASLVAVFDRDDDGNGTMQYISAIKNNVETYTDGFNDTKADVVISINKSNTITIKNAAGKKFTIQNGLETGDYDDDLGTYENQYTFGHQPPAGLTYDAKNTAVTLEADSVYAGDVNLSDYATYYNTIKKVDLTGNTAAANIYGNTLANEFVAGNGGGILDGGAITEEMLEANSKIKPTADKLTGGEGMDTYVYDAGYGKDSFVNVESQDVVLIGSAYGIFTKDDLTITDKGDVLTVVLGGDNMSTGKNDLNTTANSTFTVTKLDSSQSVKFVFDDGDDETENESFVYGDMTGLSIDSKYGTLSVDSTVASGSYFDASVINSQPKVIDARAVTDAAVVLIGNANADAIYAGAGGSTMYGGTPTAKATKDALYGGDGKDYFVFSSHEGAYGAEGDAVNNYASGDVIVLKSAPDVVKADGKTITLTWNDEVTTGDKTSTVKGSLTINGTATDDTMKKFNPIDSNVTVTFAIVDGDLFNEDGTLADLSAIETVTYRFDASKSEGKALGSGKAVWGEDAGIIDISTESEESQLAAYDWFEEAVSTDNAIGSELDSILDAKQSVDLSAQFNGDAFFTGIGQEDQSAVAAYAARHRAKK